VSNALEWHKAKHLLNLDGDDWPESLTIPDIATLHFPDDKLSADALHKMLDNALDTGAIKPSGIVTEKPIKGMQIVSLNGNNNVGQIIRDSYRPTAPPQGWKDFFAPCEIDKLTSEAFGSALYKGKLKARFKNGWPKEWQLIPLMDAQESHHYIGRLTISNSSYAAWPDKPALPEGSLLKAWLGKAEIMQDVKLTEPAGAGNDGPITGIEKRKIVRRQGQERRTHEPSQLHVFFWRVHQSFDKAKPPTSQQVWNRIKICYKEYDTDEIIQAATANEILWCSGYGNEQTFTRGTFDKTLSNLRKNPPF
jgi:hypothetical protein